MTSILNNFFTFSKEVWLALIVGMGMIYGILFGVVVGLILITDLEYPTYTHASHENMFYVSVSGLIVLSISCYFIVKAFTTNEETAPEDCK